MSYDIYLRVPTSSHAEYEFAECFSQNHTSNTAKMWYATGFDFHDWHGKTGAEMAPALTKAITWMEVDPDRYRAMEPSNGWGSYDSCLEFLKDVRDACLLHDLATVYVSS